MLVGAFEVQIHRHRPVLPPLADAVPTAAGLEPDVEDVLFLLEFVEVEALGQREIVAEDLPRRVREPAIGAVLADVRRDGQDRFLRQQDLAVRH